MPPRLFPGTLFALTLMLLAPMWLALAEKWPLSTDYIFYATILKSFSAQFWAGDFYPRWLADVNGEFGAPVFLFYPPLSFYIASFFEWFSPLDPYGLGRVILSMQLALMAMGITCYRWLSIYFDQRTAQKGALVYAAFPYLIGLMYFSFPPAQLWALAIYPFLLEAAHGISKKNPRAVLKLSIGYALLFLTHIPSAMVMFAVPLAYVAVFGDRKSTLRAAAGLLWGAAMAAVYLLPAAANKTFINSGEFTAGKFSYAENFYHLQSTIGLALIITPLFLLYLALPKATRATAFTPIIKFSLLMSMALLFMVSPLSAPVWAWLPPLSYLQFPYRFFLGMVPLAVLVAMTWLPQLKRSAPAWMTGGLLTLCVWAFVTANSAATLFTVDSGAVKPILDARAIVASEYRTQWMVKENISVLPMDKRLILLPQARIAEGRGEVSVSVWQPRKIILHVDITSKAARVTLRRFYFPGWQAEGFSVEPSHALLSIMLPRGSHDIQLSLPAFDGETPGLQISAAAIMLLGIALYRQKRKKYE